jgi:hypothetical protein
MSAERAGIATAASRCRAVLLMLIVLAPAMLQAQVAAVRAVTPSDDSVIVRRLSDSVIATIVRAEPREDWHGWRIRMIGLWQIDFSYLEGARRTVDALRETARERPPGVEHEDPLPTPWLAMDLACALHRGGRTSEAVNLIVGFADDGQREWALARLASFVARRPPHIWDTAAVERETAPDRWRAALSIARQVTRDSPRLDAMLSIAATAATTDPRSAAAAEALREARQLQLEDDDRQQARNAMLSAVAFQIGETAEGLSLYNTLERPADLWYVLRVAIHVVDSGVVRSAGPTHGIANKRELVRVLTPKVVAAGRRIKHPAARSWFLGGVGHALRWGMSEELRLELLPDYVDEDDAGRAGVDEDAEDDEPWSLDLDFLPDPPERIASHLERGDFAEARRVMRAIVGEKPPFTAARMISSAAFAIASRHPDTSRAFLMEVEGILPAVRPDSLFDRVAADIVRVRFLLGDVNRAVEMINRISDPERAVETMFGLRTNPFPSASSAEVIAASKMMQREPVRDAALRVAVERLASESGYGELTAAEALAASIRSPDHRAGAVAAIAEQLHRRRDTLAARERYIALLQDGSLSDYLAGGARDTALARILNVGEWELAEAWASSAPDPATQSQRFWELVRYRTHKIARREGRAGWNVFGVEERPCGRQF